MEIMGSVDFVTPKGHWVQSLEAENRMSNGVAEVAGEIVTLAYAWFTLL